MISNKKKKRAMVSDDCVACGVCAKSCPIGAIKVHKGVKAVVDKSTCVGCGKCEKSCPASVITLKEMELV